ncbi:Molybdopterin synthase sulfur carrier subunit [Alphaproteobacteria bacterium SO-S41]|nr:Molybdopterin synthase sulfur carrier subunit [Alphaproteobacteria bacterium SO-S41]
MRIRYFAWVRERVGRAEEEVQPTTPIATVADLADWLATRGPGYEAAFADRNRLRVAVNQDQADFTAHIAANDEIAFFPPMTGG